MTFPRFAAPTPSLIIMPTILLSTIAETRAALESRRHEHDGPIILVPTMGALHEGHATLIREGRRLAGENGTLVVSVFVNPTQFGPNEDLSAYPRSLEEDQAVCEECQVDLLFAPAPAEMYASNHSVRIMEDRLSQGLCGTSRPGHFPGVCLVVTKLFGIVQPNQAVFGKKDYQQLAVIRRLVRDLNLPVEIVGVDTVREPDGLAMSSRNQNLSQAEREAAPRFRAALVAAKERWEKTPDINPGVIARLVRSRLEQIHGAQIDYVDVVDAETLEWVETFGRPVVIAAAIKFSAARLIDNIELSPQQEED